MSRPPLRALVLAVALLVAFVACGDDPDPGTPAPSRSPGSGAVPSEPPKGEVNRPQAGQYVYEFTGTGEAEIPPNTKLTIDVSVEDDIVTNEITNNQTSAVRSIVERWESSRTLHISSTTTIGDNETSCTPEPSIEIRRLPMKVEVYPAQDWEGEGCGEGGTTTIRVTREQNVEDAGGRVWPTWKIEEKLTTPRTHLVHFFSPALGVDIRTEDRRNLTVSVLSSNP